MSITDELRGYVQSWRETPNLMDDLDAGDIDGLLGDFEHIADRIDAEYEEAITILRIEAERLCDENDQLREENAKLRIQLADVTVSMGRVEERCSKLRELCRRFSDYVSHDRCEGCVYKSRCNDGLIDECWQLTEIRELASELRVEVDG